MALVKCPGCFKQISNTASICPYCGCRVSEKRAQNLSTQRFVIDLIVKAVAFVFRIITTLPWWIFGLVTLLTIVGAKRAKEIFSLSVIVFSYNYKSSTTNCSMATVANVIWRITFGWILSLFHIIIGILLFSLIIPYAWGIQQFKFAKLAFTPFGATVNSAEEIWDGSIFD